MSKKIAIILESKGTNKYYFKKVTDIFPEENNIVISNKNYNKLVNSEEIKLVENQLDPEKDICLIFDETELVKQATKNGESEEKAQETARKALTSIGNNITNVTIETAGDMSELNVSFTKEKKKEFNINAINPETVIKKIKEKVVAQDEAVETMVRYIHRNQLIIETQTPEEIERKKGNILLDGPTGTGKTYIMKQVASHMELPIVITQATMYTSTGYQGVELQQMLVELLKATDGDLEAAQRGIIVLDEFDKLGNGKGDSPLEIRKAVQQDLLTYMSGAKYTVEYNGKSYDFDTSRITFVCLGAFTDYREKQKDNLDENGNYKMYSEDYINAGIMREMVGRFKIMASTQKYSKAALKKILTESSASPLKDLVSTGKDIYKTKIIFEDAIIDEIAEHAYNMNTGARSLQTVTSDIEYTILKTLEANRMSGVEQELVITPEIMKAATAKYENQHNRGEKNK